MIGHLVFFLAGVITGAAGLVAASDAALAITDHRVRTYDPEH